MLKSGPDMLSCLAFVDGCETLVQGHLQSASRQVVSKYSTGLPFLFPLVSVFMIQSMATMKRSGDSKHLCLTPVLISKFFVSLPSWMTLHDIPSYECLIMLTDFVGTP